MRPFGLMFGFTKANGMPWLNFGILGNRDADDAWGRIGIVDKSKKCKRANKDEVSRMSKSIFPVLI
jgi:hypothetical protein